MQQRVISNRSKLKGSIRRRINQRIIFTGSSSPTLYPTLESPEFDIYLMKVESAPIVRFATYRRSEFRNLTRFLRFTNILCNCFQSLHRNSVKWFHLLRLSVRLDLRFDGKDRNYVILLFEKRR